MASEWRKTQGGHWRNTKTGKLYTGKGDPNKQGSSSGGSASAGYLNSNLPNFQKPNYNSYGGMNSPAEASQAQLDTGNYIQQQNLAANRPNETNPWGGRQFSFDPATGQWTANQTLSGNQNQINQQTEQADISAGDTANRSLNQAGQNYQNPYSYQGIAQAPGQDDALGYARQTQDSIYNRFQTKMQPQFDKQKAGLQQQLADQGIPIGSKLYNDQMFQLQQQQNDAYDQARATANSQATSEANTVFGMGQTGRQQNIQEYQDQRNAPAAEAQTMLGLRRGVVNPNYTAINTGITQQTPDVIGGAANFYGSNASMKNAQTAAGAAIESANISANASMHNADQAAAGNTPTAAELASGQKSLNTTGRTQQGFTPVPTNQPKTQTGTINSRSQGWRPPQPGQTGMLQPVRQFGGQTNRRTY